MARNVLCTKSDIANGVVFAFADGTSIQVTLNQIPEVIHPLLTRHGLKQKLGDSYAGCDTVGEAREEFNDVLATLVAGKWSERVAGVPRIGLLVEALTRMAKRAGKTFNRAAFDALAKEQVAAMRKISAVITEMAAIQAERAATVVPKVSVEQLFG